MFFLLQFLATITTNHYQTRNDKCPEWSYNIARWFDINTATRSAAPVGTSANNAGAIAAATANNANTAHYYLAAGLATTANAIATTANCITTETCNNTATFDNNHRWHCVNGGGYPTNTIATNYNPWHTTYAYYTNATAAPTTAATASWTAA